MGAKWRTTPIRLLLLVLLLSWASLGFSDEAKRHFAVAAQFFHQEQWDFACEEFELFLQQHPSSPLRSEAKYFLAQSHAHLDQVATAKALFRDLLEAEKQTTWTFEARVRLAELEYQSESHRAVVELLRFLPDLDHPKASSLLMMQASSYQALGELSQAESIYREILCLWPHAETARTALYNCLLCAAGREDLNAAEQLCSAWPELLQEDSTDVSPRVIYARLLFDAQGYREVASLLQEDDSVESLYLRAIAHRELGQKQQMITEFRQIIQLGIETQYYFPAAWEVVRHLNANQQFAETLPLYESMISNYEVLAHQNADLPALDELQFEYAVAALKCKEFSLATKIFAEVYHRTTKPDLRVPAGYELARLHHQEGRNQAALDVLGDLINAADTSLQTEILFLQATIQVKQKRWEHAQTTLTQYLAVTSPDTIQPQAELWLAECLLQTNQTTQGIAKLAAIANAPASPAIAADALLRAAQIQLSLQNYSKAEEFLIQRRTRFADAERNDEMYYILGRCAAHQGEFEQARRHYRQAVTVSQNREIAARAQWMIGEAFFHQHDYLQACRAYHQVALRYQHPTWTAAALLQAGKCHELLGDVTHALACYQRIDPTGETQFHQEGRKRLAELQNKTTK